MSEAPATAAGAASAPSPRGRWGWLSPGRLALLAVVAAAIVYAQFGVLTRPVGGDPANWEYMAQVIVRGGLPYRDATNIKSPLSAYLGAGAMLVGRPLGLPDVYATRFASFSMAVLCVGLTVLVAYEYFLSRRIAILAGLLLLSLDSFPITNSAGIQPKTPLLLFGLASVWAVRRDRPFLAGALGMLAALCWQPGLLFVGAAGLAASRCFTQWRDGRVVKLGAGACLPLAILLGYFWKEDSLRDFYLWGFHYNLTVYAPNEMKSAAQFLGYLEMLLRNQYRDEWPILGAGMLGLVYAAGREIYRAKQGGYRTVVARAPFYAVMVVPLAYLAFWTINAQGAADLLPFLPSSAIFAAVAVVSLLDYVTGRTGRPPRWRLNPAIGTVAFLGICGLVVYGGVLDAFAYRGGPPSLRQQQAAVGEITAQLQPGDKIYVHGTTEILVLAGLSNASRHYFLDRGKDDYLDLVEPGGFRGWLDRLKAERPKIVALSRLGRVRRAQAFIAWVDSEYDRRQSRWLTYYVRRD